MPKNLVRIKAWELPLDFYELPDDDARIRAMEAVCCKAEPFTGPRTLPPMTVWQEVLVLFFCSLVGTPLVGLVALGASYSFGWYELIAGLLVVAVALTVQPLPHVVRFRRHRLALLMARYFALEFIVDRDDGPVAATVCTAAAFQGLSDGTVVASDGIPRLHLACPHGVMNYGAHIFTSLSRWMVGVDQVTAAAAAVMGTPGLRQFAAPLWPISASRGSLLKRLGRGETIGIIPDGIQGIFAADDGGGDDALVLGKKRGLVRLALQTGAVCMPTYFVGTLQLYTIWQDRWGVLAALSRKLRLSLFLFFGRWGLPIPRRHPLTAIVAFVPPPGGHGVKLAEPSVAELEAHHEAVYKVGLVQAYEKAKMAAGLQANAKLVVS